MVGGMRYSLCVVVLAVSAAGCATGVSLRKWESMGAHGVVTAGLCKMCATPYDSQVSRAREMMAEKCGGSSIKIEREGTESGPQEVFLESRGGFAANADGAAGGYRTSAGTKRDRFYFWEFACR